MDKIFISHATKDRPLASDLQNLLLTFITENKLENKYEIFYAPETLKNKPGSLEWKQSLKTNMEDSTYCLVLLTPNSIENRWVNYELGLASASKKNEKDYSRRSGRSGYKYGDRQ
ncbi:MAG: toll/interleukin-1 receptor domain-containing protein [Bacteroides sp.]|nr:toll/interleukin-1 receptor domain-containing protein [Bacteroides sp.]